MTSSITSFEEEYRYWEGVASSADTLADRERAQLFQSLLKGVKDDLLTLHIVSISALHAIASRVEEVLDDIWKQIEFESFPKERMRNLIRVTTKAFAQAIREKLTGTDVWKKEYYTVKEDLQGAVSACSRWQTAVEELTGQFWHNFGAKMSAEELTSLSSRVLHVLSIRTMHEQLQSLLTQDEQRAFATDSMFDVFLKIDCLDVSEDASNVWNAVVSSYNKQLEPVEAVIATKLRVELKDLSTSASSVQAAQMKVIKYRELIVRPGVARGLQSEREVLLNQFRQEVEDIKQDAGAITADAEDEALRVAIPTSNMSGVVRALMQIRQLSARLKNVLSLCDPLLVDLHGTQQLLADVAATIHELKQQEKEVFQDWVRTTESELEDEDIMLETTGRIMQFNQSDGKLIVHFSDDLMTRLREIRQLRGMGMVIPQSILKPCNAARVFYKHAVILKQVAHFYNSIDEQILDSQYLMLEAYARELEGVIKRPLTNATNKHSTSSSDNEMVRWKNMDQLDTFIVQLQQAANKLTTENRKLRQKHQLFEGKVLQLMNIDLLKQQGTWKEAFAFFRSTCTQLSSQGISKAAMRPWQNHWDHQVYKALYVQYMYGLENLHESLPEIKIELVFRQQALQFRPPLEDVRSKYYRELKRFLIIPDKIGGVGDGAVYKYILSSSSKAFKKVYKRAEQLFHRLAKVAHQFKEWVVVGAVDIEALASEHLQEAADWEGNFRMIKAKGREAEKLPNSVKVDCILVSTTPVKSAIDDHIQRLFDALVNSLRKSINKHVSAIDSFVEKGMDALSMRPQSLEEIGEVNRKHAELSREKPSLKPMFELAHTKNKLLKGVAGSGVDLNSLQQRWDKFELMLDSHTLMVKEQVDVMRNSVQTRVEDFGKNVENFATKWEAVMPRDADMQDRQAALKAVETIKERLVELEALEQQAENIRKEGDHFDVDVPGLAHLQSVSASVHAMEKTWTVFEEFCGELDKFSKEEWIILRSKTHTFADFLDEWSVRMKKDTPNAVSLQIQSDLEKYRALLPVLRYVRGDAFSPDHWVEMFGILRMDATTPVESILFGNILSASQHILDNMEQVKDLHSRAQGEVTIREALHEIDLWGASAQFTLSAYEDFNGLEVPLIKDWKDTTTKVGDNQSLLASLKDSPYYPPFQDKAELWNNKLAELGKILELLNIIQRKWIYLEPIFGRGALPKEQPRFQQVDKDFKQIMVGLKHDGRVMGVVGHTGRIKRLESMEDQLSRCQKSLNEFLEQKRSLFPRFYFIGDDDLLEILGQSTNPTVIQSHLKKLFAGINTVGFNDDNTLVVSMYSQDGEVVPLTRPVQITSDVETWLKDLADAMVEALTKSLQDCVATDPPQPSQFASQVLCVAEQVKFTRDCQQAILSQKLAQYKETLAMKLQSYTGVEVDTSDPEGHVLDLKLKALILDVIHMIEIVDLLISNRVVSLNHWFWQKHLRYSLDPNSGKCVIRMLDATFNYTYEYQGNTPKLVHTPLTDKCYLTLTQGMHLGLGGNPYGPAGTGKTESVKALGNAMGRQVLVFNCDEGIDVKSMGRIFVGLVKCGAWGCFDEFNRLEEAVLSAVSMQIQVIQAALKQHLPEAKLLGRNVDIDPNSGIFITLNPAGKGYGGRQKLPDNLKQLFRPVAMSRPDLELICEVMLFAEGFEQAKELGPKLVALYTMAKELLSPQQHYDWGLRALKTILRGAGKLLGTARRRNNSADSSNASDSSEAFLLVQAARANTISKLSFSDARRFDSLINNVFTNVQLREIEYEELSQAVLAAYEELGLMPMQSQTQKMFELYEQLQQRMGVVIVGPSGSGKSVIWKVLQRALSKLGQQKKHPIKQYVMNPKSMPRQRLLGHIDVDTREWSDGVLTAAARQVVREPLDQHSWIVCDGDIDPEWIESLNSVLDDNRLLTMPSGERIQFGPNVNFVFETHDLSCASPATISRMGMIFLSDEDTDTKSLVRAWVEDNVPEEYCLVVDDFLNDHFFRSLDFVLDSSTSLMATQGRVGLVFNALSQIKGVFTTTELAVRVIRGLGGALSIERRSDLAKHLFSWIREPLPDSRRPLDVYVDSLGNLTSYVSQANVELSVSDLVSNPLVMTTNVQRMLDTLNPWMEQRLDFVVIGPEGSGKTNLLFSLFQQQPSTAVAVLHCNAQTGPDDVVDKLSQSCMVVNAGTKILRPRDSEQLILFIKDINLPKPDKWGTSFLIQFLQQLISYHGFYDQNLEWVRIEGIQIVASMNPSSTLGRHTLTSRFSSTVKMLYVDYPEDSQLQEVYSNMLQPLLQVKVRGGGGGQFSSPQNITRLAQSMVSVYSYVHKHFTRDTHGHYIFTPAHLTEWVLSLFRFDLENIHVLDAWLFSAQILFRNTLISKDQPKFDSTVATILMNDWGYDVNTMDNSIFTTFVPSTVNTFGQGNALTKISLTDYSELLSTQLTKHNREHPELNIRLFDELLHRVAAIEYAISSPVSGNVLLAGRAGCGRRSALKLVSYIMDIKEIRTPHIGRVYELKDFRNDLKVAMEEAGACEEDHPVVLLIEDYQLLQTSFTELLNSLISTGDIPGLFTKEELEPLLVRVKNRAGDEGWRGSTYSFFTHKVKFNLHVVLALDSSRPDFSYTCESNPAFIKECRMVWAASWSAKSMQTLPPLILKDQVPDAITEDATLLLQVGNMYKDACKFGGASPHDFTQHIRAFSALYNAKTTEIHTEMKRFGAGLQKLQDASALVDELKAKASEQKKVLATKQAAAAEAMEDIERALTQASSQKVEAEHLKKMLAEEEKKLNHRKEDIEEQLSTIKPTLEAAKKAVGNIKTKDLTEIKSLRAPPPGVSAILTGVMMLMGINNSSWKSMKSFLSRRGVQSEIVDFDQRRITEDIRANVEEFLVDNGKYFELENAKRASKAAAPLSQWVKANLAYSSVLVKVAPLEEENHVLEENLRESEVKLKHLTDEVGKIDAYVADLRKKYTKNTEEGARLQIKVEDAQKTIDAAEGLISKLDGERVRWHDQVKEYELQLSALPLEALLSAGFLVYLPQASEGVRADLTKKWCDDTGLLADNPTFSPLSFLSTENDQLVWRSEGLPSDQLSLENGAVVSSKLDKPLFLVDPSRSGLSWIKKHLSNSPVDIASQKDENFGTNLELAIRFGKTFVVQDVHDIEPILYPIIKHEFVLQGSRMCVHVGEKVVDYNETFRLILTTRRPRANLPPEIKSHLTEVNFTVTREGLAGQLLARTLEYEKPELEMRKTELVKKEEELKLSLNQLENRLLVELANAEGNILENKTLLASLNETKESSSVISASLEESQKLQESLNQERYVYLPLARHASKLYFLMGDLVKVNNMYQFSLASFVELFQRALRGVDRVDAPAVRIKALCTRLQQLVYSHVARSLFKRDRTIFAMHLVHGLFSDEFEGNEWNVLLQPTTASASAKGGKQTSSSMDKRLAPGWVPLESVPSLLYVLENTSGLSQAAQLNDEGVWRDWLRHPTCEKAFPRHVVRLVHQLLLVKALRPDRLPFAMSSLACRLLGLKDLSPAADSLKELYAAETNSGTPILAIVSPGADPSQELQELARKQFQGDSSRLVEVAMGQGQAEVAIGALRKCAQTGCWLYLKNLHLVTHWLPTLEQELSMLEPDDGFRLWLTTEPHARFSSVLLQSSLKLSMEAPPGIKRNLLRTYDTLDSGVLSQSSLVAQTMFCLAWFHAIVQERRNYIPHGWSKFYEFSAADLRVSVDVLGRWGRQQKKRKDGGDAHVDWTTLHGTILNALYGGRVDNVFDEKILSTYLREFFCDDVMQTGAHSSGRRARLAPGVSIPTSTHLSDHVEMIQHLPDTDDPEVFGLPANVNKAVQQGVGEHILQSLMTVQREGVLDDGFDRDRWRKELEPFIRTWFKRVDGTSLVSDNGGRDNLLSSKEKKSGRMSLIESDGDDAIVSFVKLERHSGMKVICAVHSDMQELSGVMQGTLLLSPRSNSIARSLLQQETPMEWQRMWGGPDHPLEWTRLVVSKTLALGGYVKKAVERVLLSEKLNINSFFRPGTLLNAIRQETASQFKCSMDSLHLVCEWGATKVGSTHISLVLDGIGIQGCSFSGSQLKAVDRDSAPLSKMPHVCVGWVPSELFDAHRIETTTISLPLYESNDRQVLISKLTVPCETQRHMWVKAGVALFMH
eukprot:m.8317 g.8317  ORF g.8317 m.8317 type:complete len:4146 (-) comp6080_c0_seq1:66-12503(-)